MWHMQMQRDIQLYLHKMRYSVQWLPKHTNLVRHKENMMISLFYQCFAFLSFFGHVLMILNCFLIFFWEVDPTQEAWYIIEEKWKLSHCSISKLHVQWIKEKYVYNNHKLIIDLCPSIDVQKKCKIEFFMLPFIYFLLFPHQNHIFR